MRHEVMLPIELNTDAIEQKIEKDGYDELMVRLYERCEAELPMKWPRAYGCGQKVPDWAAFVEHSADRFMREHQDEIIEAATKRLVDRMTKTKAYKEAVSKAVAE